MFILIAIPIVNVIAAFMWILGSNVNRNKKNFAIAFLIVAIIAIIISFVLGGIMVTLLMPIIDELQYY